MTYQECVDYILSIPKFADKLGTESLYEILGIMNHPENGYPAIHVAGTNGKGSTCSFLASILKEKGKRVGIFTSPHLIRLNERIRINNDIISDDEFVDVCEKVIDVVNEASKKDIAHPSFFEFVFLMCVIYFYKKKVDYAIFETGMGGRLDATNVLNPKICIITSVGLDHMQYLGDTIEKIAYEKAGIIKKNVPVIYFDRKDNATGIIADYCNQIGGRLYIVEKNQYNLMEITKKTIDFSFQSVYYSYDSLKIRKTALYQVENAVLAVRAYELLLYSDLSIDDRRDALHRDLFVIRNGLINMTWSGRMELIADGIYVDGAHNEEAIEAFCNTLEIMFSDDLKILLFAVSKDKDYKRMIERLGRISFDEIILVKYNGDRSAELDIVEETFRHFSGSRITTFDNIETGFDYAKTHVGNRLLFCVGSLYLVGDLLRIQEYRND